jgi:hypothetical protein
VCGGSGPEPTQEMMPVMHRVLTRRFLGLVALAGFAWCGCNSAKTETREEMLGRALNNKDLPDSGAIMLIGQATFRGFKEAATLPPVEGKVVTTVIVKGEDTSGVAQFIKEDDPRAIKKKLKELQFISLLRELDRFLENARKRNLGDLTLTLQVPIKEKPGPDDWTDAYRFRLPAKSFDLYLKTAPLETTDRISRAERIWKVAFDQFN